MKLVVRYLSLSLVVIFISVSCASPARFYKQGKYYAATVAAAKKLRSKPDDIETQQILQDSYRLAIENAQRSINSMQYQSDPLKYYSIVKQYENLCDMAQKIYSSPKANEIITAPIDFSAELAAAKNAGAEAYYSKAEALLATNSIADARLAFDYLKNANNFVVGYKDMNALIAEAKYKSVLRVEVTRPFVHQAYELSADFFYEDLIAELNDKNVYRDVEFYTPQMTKNVFIHQSVTIDFSNFFVQEPKDTRRIVQCRRDSVLTGYTNVRGAQYPVYSTVRATLTEYTRTILAQGSLVVKIVDNATKRVLKQQKISSDYVWQTRWATYQGDERALSQTQLNMCRRIPEMSPMPQEFFYEVTRPMYAKAVGILSNFYRGY